MKQLFFLLLICSSFSVYAAQTDSRRVQLFSNALMPEQFNLTFDCAAVQRFAGVVSSRNLYVPCMDERGALWDFSPGTFCAQRYAKMFCQTTLVSGSWVLRSDTLSYFVRSELDTSLYVLCMVKNGLACPLMDEAAQCPVLQLTDDGKINSFKIFNFAGTSDPMLQQAEAFAQVNTTLHRRFCEQWNKLPEGASNTIFAHEDPWSLLVHGELPQMVDRLQLLLLPHAVQQKYAHFLKNWHDEVYCQMPNISKPQRLILPDKFLKGYTAYTLQMVAPDLAPGPLYNFSCMLGAVPPLITLVPCIPVPMVALVPCVPVVCAVPSEFVQEVETKQDSVAFAQSQTTRSVTSKTGKRRAARKRSSSKAQAHIQERMHQQTQGSNPAPVIVPEASQVSRPTEEESAKVENQRVEQIVAQFNSDLFVHLPGDHVINFTESEETVCEGEQKSKFAQREEKLQQQLAQAQANLQERMKELQKKRIAALIARNKARQEKLRNEIEALKTARKLHSEELAQWDEKLAEEEKIIARAELEGKGLFGNYCKSLVQDIQAVVRASVRGEHDDKQYGQCGELVADIHRIAEKLRFFEKYQGLYQRQEMIVDNSVFEAKSVDEGWDIASSFGNWCNAWFGKETVSSWVVVESAPSVNHLQKTLVTSALRRKKNRGVLERGKDVAPKKNLNLPKVNDQSIFEHLSRLDTSRVDTPVKRSSTKTKLEALFLEFAITLEHSAVAYLATIDDVDLIDKLEEDIGFITQKSSICQVFSRIFEYEVAARWSHDRPLQKKDVRVVFSFLNTLARMKCCGLSSSEQKRKYLQEDFFNELLNNVCEGRYEDFSEGQKIALASEVCAAVYVMQKNKENVPSNMYLDAVALYARISTSDVSQEYVLTGALHQLFTFINSHEIVKNLAIDDQASAIQKLMPTSAVDTPSNFGFLLTQLVAKIVCEDSRKKSLALGDFGLTAEAVHVARVCVLAEENEAFIKRCHGNPDIERFLQPVITLWTKYAIEYRQQQQQGIFFPGVYVWLYNWRQAFTLFGIPDEPSFLLFQPSEEIHKKLNECSDVLRMHAAKK